MKKIEETNIKENHVSKPAPLVGIKKIQPNTQEEIESPFRRKRTLGSVKIDIHASAVKEETNEEEIHD